MTRDRVDLLDAVACREAADMHTAEAALLRAKEAVLKCRAMGFETFDADRAVERAARALNEQARVAAMVRRIAAEAAARCDEQEAA